MLRWRGLALILAASILLLSFSGLAHASTAAIDKAASQVQSLKDLIAQLDDQMSAATEAYDYANQQLADTQGAVAKTTKQLSQAGSDLAVAQDKLNQRVVEIYKNGDVTALAVLVDANSFSDLVTRYEQLARIGRQDAQLVKQVQAYTTQVADNKAKLDSQLRQQTTLVTQTATAKQEVLGQLAKQKQALKGKEAQVAQLRKDEAARQLALAAAAQKAAEEAARQAQLAAAKAAAAKATTTTTSGGKPRTTTTTTTARGGKTTTTTSGRTTTTTTSAPETTTTTTAGGGGGGSRGAKGAEVVKIALQYLGVPYVWGGYSPSGFDCSGLVKYCYAKLGVYLPHSSAMQFSYGTPVAQDQLKIGDIVFFYNPIHHVGIYIGNGNMINATGDHVQIGTVHKSSYHGARRIFN